MLWRTAKLRMEVSMSMLTQDVGGYESVNMVSHNGILTMTFDLDLL